jgi:hypothetical protein
MKACSYAIMTRRRNDFDLRAQEIIAQLDRYPPFSWYLTAIAASSFVWAAIGMALLLAYNTPTIGLGCWSGSFLLYGILSSFTFLLHLFNSRNKVIWWICHLLNALSLLWLFIITFLMVSNQRHTVHGIGIEH